MWLINIGAIALRAMTSRFTLPPLREKAPSQLNQVTEIQMSNPNCDNVSKQPTKPRKKNALAHGIYGKASAHYR
jgi:hypothetical protein